MTVENFHARDTSITINGHVVEIGLPIMDVVEVGELHILRINDFTLPSDDPVVGRNVVAIDQDGHEVWRIEDFWYKIEDRDGRRIPDSYSHIQIGKDGKLYAFQPIGFLCEIDLKTGKILHEKQTR